MMTMTMNTGTAAMVRRDDGFTARLAVTWAMAGGVLAGGFLVAFMTLAGRLNGNAVLVTATGLFLLGAAAGFVLGALVGWFGRPAGVGGADVARAFARVALMAVPAMAVAYLATGWMAATVVVLYAGKPLMMVLGAGAWLTGAAIVFWAVVEAAAANFRTRA